MRQLGVYKSNQPWCHIGCAQLILNVVKTCLKLPCFTYVDETCTKVPARYVQGQIAASLSSLSWAKVNCALKSAKTVKPLCNSVLQVASKRRICQPACFLILTI